MLFAISEQGILLWSQTPCAFNLLSLIKTIFNGGPMKKFLLFLLALTLLAGCTATKYTATAVGEGTKEAAEQVND
jgi:hypothetical protein